MKWLKRYDREMKEYIFTGNGEDSFNIFRTGFGGDVEWTGIRGDWSGGYKTFYQAVLDLMGMSDFREYMKGRSRP